MVEVTNYRKYRIKLKDRRIVAIEMNGQNVKTFNEPDNRSKLPKLYVVKSGSEVIYVGQTTQNMRTRFRQGLQAKGITGYYGYMWKDLPQVDVLIWDFPGKSNEFVEGIEGELVFLFRSRKGKWPEYQMEIHFHNVSKDDRRLIEAIYKVSCE
jgi:hypothetical protein